MHPLRSRPVSQRRLAWLLWFGLLFPMAQASAAWHALSHVPQEVRRAADDKQAPHQTHCDLCLMAAAIGGGAPLAEPPSVIAPAIDRELPPADVVAVWIARPARAYRSRAPPLASR
jgi:hypothetical protein